MENHYFLINRRYIFIHGWFSIVMLVFLGAPQLSYDIGGAIFLNTELKNPRILKSHRVAQKSTVHVGQ